jgi:5'-3' exonuclease
MKELNEGVKQYFNNPKKYNLQNIILSSSDESGEGEHKIFEYIRTYQDTHLNQNTLIYGLDADLIMLCINHLSISPNIYLFRETPHFIQSLNCELEPNAIYFIDIPELAKIISSEMSNPRSQELRSQENDVSRIKDTSQGVRDTSRIKDTSQGVRDTSRISDYIFICFFLGNDFMPHFPALNIRTGGIDKLINAYKETIGNTADILTDGKQIYWKNVKRFVAYLANLEPEFILQETQLREKRERIFYSNNRTHNEHTPILTEEKERLKGLQSENIVPFREKEGSKEKQEMIPTFERQVEKYINIHEPNWEKRYYKSLFHLEIDETRKKQICKNYLEGLEWTMFYYTTGCVDWRWKYNYHYPPLLTDLLKELSYGVTPTIWSNLNKPVNELFQLSYVLPKHSLYLLPDHIHKYLVKNKKEWYPTNAEYVWSYCKYLWESHVDLPPIEFEELEQIIQSNP